MSKQGDSADTSADKGQAVPITIRNHFYLRSPTIPPDFQEKLMKLVVAQMLRANKDMGSDDWFVIKNLFWKGDAGITVEQFEAQKEQIHQWLDMSFPAFRPELEMQKYTQGTRSKKYSAFTKGPVRVLNFNRGSWPEPGLPQKVFDELPDELQHVACDLHNDHVHGAIIYDERTQTQASTAAAAGASRTEAVPYQNHL